MSCVCVKREVRGVMIQIDAVLQHIFILDISMSKSSVHAAPRHGFSISCPLRLCTQRSAPLWAGLAVAVFGFVGGFVNGRSHSLLRVSDWCKSAA